MSHYLCCDALNPAGRPGPADIKTVGFTGVRSVFFDRPEWYGYHGLMKGAGLASVATLARESFGPGDRADTIGNLPVDVDMVVIGNEPDSTDPSSWSMSPSSFRSLIQECAPLIAIRCPNAKIVAGGLVSGQPGWLEPIAEDLRPLVDYLDIHPYSKTPSEAETLLDEYYERYNIPLVIFEWNRPPVQIDGFLYMLSRTAQADAWFAWSDGMVQDFGLVTAQGYRKTEYYAMQRSLAAAQPPTPQYQFVLGFKEMADRHPDLIGQPLENESGPWKNSSFQRSTTGLLIWGDFWEVRDQKGFISNSGQRWVWKTDHLERV